MSTIRDRSGITSEASEIPSVTVKVDGVPVSVDPLTLSMRERQMVNKAVAGLGYPADEMDLLTGAIWVTLRRTRPDLTYEEVCDSLTMADLMAAEADDDDEVGADPEGSGGR